jgi:glycosyltransferase involved in cell wall biosynthesis
MVILEGMSTLDVTILMPCLNEAETLAVCVRKARAAIEALGRPGEVLIADNGSTDGSQAIAIAEGARVIPVPVRGYGAALIAGIQSAEGKYILMADADDSYDFGHLPRFVAALDTGKDLVMGNRFKGGIINGAMPPLHRYLGNPVLSFIGRLFFKVPIGDFHCGIRAFRADSMRNLNLRTTGMEFASEMVVKASLQKLVISEVPTTLQPDGRTRAPHLRTWRDGWRHLRFLLMYSPRWLFFYPGIFLSVIGLVLSAWLIGGERQIGSMSFDVDTLAYALGILLIGVQITVFAVSAKVFGTREGFLPVNPQFEKVLDAISLESGLILGVLLLLAGLGTGLYAVAQWHAASFGHLTATHMLRLTLPSAAALMLGVEAIFASFFLGLLQIHRR